MKPAGAIIAALVALATSGCAPPIVGAPSDLPAWSAIGMETFSWGRPVSSWRLMADGEGTYTHARDVPGGAFRDYDLVTHRFSAGRQGFTRMVRLLAGAAAGYPCQIEVTDGPYGRILWSGAALPPLQREFNLGCQSPEASAVQAQMAEAEALVRGWALPAPIAETREVRQPRP